jgi:hypothetical protein
MEDMLPASALASLKLSRSALFLSFKKIYQGKFLSFFLLFYYSYVYTRLGSFLPPAPSPSLTTHSTPSFSPLKVNFKKLR